MEPSEADLSQNPLLSRHISFLLQETEDNEDVTIAVTCLN